MERWISGWCAATQNIVQPLWLWNESGTNDVKFEGSNGRILKFKLLFGFVQIGAHKLKGKGHLATC